MGVGFARVWEGMGDVEEVWRASLLGLMYPFSPHSGRLSIS
jgi:hypothetical protein